MNILRTANMVVDSPPCNRYRSLPKNSLTFSLSREFQLENNIDTEVCHSHITFSLLENRRTVATQNPNNNFSAGTARALPFAATPRPTRFSSREVRIRVPVPPKKKRKKRHLASRGALQRHCHHLGGPVLAIGLRLEAHALLLRQTGRRGGRAFSTSSACGEIAPAFVKADSKRKTHLLEGANGKLTSWGGAATVTEKSSNLAI